MYQKLILYLNLCVLVSWIVCFLVQIGDAFSLNPPSLGFFFSGRVEWNSQGLCRQGDSTLLCRASFRVLPSTWWNRSSDLSQARRLEPHRGSQNQQCCCTSSACKASWQEADHRRDRCWSAWCGYRHGLCPIWSRLCCLHGCTRYGATSPQCLPHAPSWSWGAACLLLFISSFFACGNGDRRWSSNLLRKTCVWLKLLRTWIFWTEGVWFVFSGASSSFWHSNSQGCNFWSYSRLGHKCWDNTLHSWLSGRTTSLPNAGAGFPCSNWEGD